RLYINGAGKGQRRGGGAAGGEYLAHVRVAERAIIGAFNFVRLRQPQQVAADNTAGAAPLVKAFRFPVNAAGAVMVKIAAVEKPAGTPDVPVDPFRQAVADAIVGIDRHDVGGVAGARLEAADGELAGFIAIERAVIVSARHGELDVHVADRGVLI